MSAPTHKQLAGNQRRTLRAIRAKLLRMSDEWDGTDQYNMSALTTLADQIEKLAMEMVTGAIEET